MRPGYPSGTYSRSLTMRAVCLDEWPMSLKDTFSTSRTTVPATKTSLTTFFVLHRYASQTRYWRAVGYFSSYRPRILRFSSGRIHQERRNSIRLVTSVELSSSDLEAIQNGAPKGPDVCTQRLDSHHRN